MGRVAITPEIDGRTLADLQAVAMHGICQQEAGAASSVVLAFCRPSPCIETSTKRQMQCLVQGLQSQEAGWQLVLD